MKHFLLVFLAGCLFDHTDTNTTPTLPPPVVDAMSPATGTYGTTITISGSGFGASGGLAFAQPAATAGYGTVVTSWSDTQIVARVPFPTTVGPIHIKTGGGETDTDVFTPVTPWTAGDSATLPTLLEAQPLANGAAALGFDLDKVELVVFDGGHATTTTLTGVATSTDDRRPIRARLALDAQGAPVVFATNTDGNIVEFVAGAPVVTGLAGTVMAAGRDTTGPYVWFRTDAGLSRARPGATFSIDRGPIADVGALDAEVADDGTLVVARSVDANVLFDNEAYLGIARLAPAATSFAIGENADGMAWDDYIAAAHLRISPDGGRMFAEYAAQQNDETQDHPCPSVVRDAAGTWGYADGLLDGREPVAYLPTTIAALDDTSGELALVPDIAGGERDVLPVWPADAAALLLDGQTLRPLIRVGQQIYYPTMP